MVGFRGPDLRAGFTSSSLSDRMTPFFTRPNVEIFGFDESCEDARDVAGVDAGGDVAGAADSSSESENRRADFRLPPL